jgi:hypothetical protein
MEQNYRRTGSVSYTCLTGHIYTKTPLISVNCENVDVFINEVAHLKSGDVVTN